MMEAYRQSGGFTPPVVAKRTSRYRGSVAPEDGTGVGQMIVPGWNVYPVKSERYFTGACPLVPCNGRRAKHIPLGPALWNACEG